MPKTSLIPSDTAPTLDDFLVGVDSAGPTTKKYGLPYLLALIYPIGCIYTEITGTNPNTTFGFGTWTAFGAGKVPVGFDSGDADFDSVEGTGGEKTHTLTTTEMPSHAHGLVRSLAEASGYGLTTSASFTNRVIIESAASGDASTNNTGSGGAHNNLQPFIVVYMWKRTA